MTEVKPKLYEIVSQIKFATVILATSEQQALAYVKGCLSAEDMLIPSNADCIGYNSDFDVEDIRDVPSGYDTEKILEDLAHHDATDFEVEEQPCPKN